MPLIEHVCRRALEACIGEVVLTSDDDRVLRCAPKGVRVMLDSNIPLEHCGSDRVAYTYDVGGWDREFIINLQGDMPFIFPGLIQFVAAARERSTADIVTAAAPINPVVVEGFDASDFLRVFHYQHIGIYAFTRESLKRFASFPPSDLEKLYYLEQFRAIENGMSIEVVRHDWAPLEINTEADLFHANTIADAIWCTEDARSGD